MCPKYSTLVGGVFQGSITLDMNITNQYVDLLDNEIDIALRIEPLEDSKFMAQYLWSSGYLLCASPSYFEGKNKIEKPEDIIKHQGLLICQQAKFWEFRNLESSEIIRVEPKAKLILNDINLGAKATIQGLGLARLPKFYADTMIKKGKLVSLLNNYEIMHKRDIYAVYPSKKFLSKKTQVLLDFIKQKSKRYSEVLEK
ncbi:MAG: DNA-binding transcriptional LysR family regulator [bacterium]|jgi:DNA-binding transcriptional LysR family regulator